MIKVKEVRPAIDHVLIETDYMTLKVRPENVVQVNYDICMDHKTMSEVHLKFFEGNTEPVVITIAGRAHVINDIIKSTTQMLREKYSA